MDGKRVSVLSHFTIVREGDKPSVRGDNAFIVTVATWPIHVIHGQETEMLEKSTPTVCE